MFCPNCGTSIRGSETFCPACGSRIASATPLPEGGGRQNLNAGSGGLTPIRHSGGMSQPVAVVCALILAIYEIAFIITACQTFLRWRDGLFWYDDELRLFGQFFFLLFALDICIACTRYIIQTACQSKKIQWSCANTGASLIMTAIILGGGKYILENVSWSRGYESLALMYSLATAYEPFVWPMAAMGIMLVFAFILIKSCTPKDAGAGK